MPTDATDPTNATNATDAVGAALHGAGPAPIAVAMIERNLSPGARDRIEAIEHFSELESTNRHLLAGRPPAPGRLRVALAEYQHGGRGRHGRRWIMPPGAGIALSASWHFATPPRELPSLSLAVGAAARRAIQDAVGLAIGLKWPNDLVLDGGKLGGILIEIDPLGSGACHVVAGIGINVGLPSELLAGLSDLPGGARDLVGALPNVAIDRAEIAAALIERFVELFVAYAATGFAPWREEWLAAHVLADRRVELRSADGRDFGVVRGIDGDGALIVEDDAGVRRRVVSGEVTVRERA